MSTASQMISRPVHRRIIRQLVHDGGGTIIYANGTGGREAAVAASRDASVSDGRVR